MIVQVITLAFLVVGASVGVMIPIMLYVLDLKSSGWNWQYVALFISILASTDAVAIIATMKTSEGPRAPHSPLAAGWNFSPPGVLRVARRSRCRGF